MQPDEPTEILKACRRLSNILEPEELYAVFADVIKKKFAIRHLAIFLYRQTADALELAFNEGLGKLSFKIKKIKALSGNPFPEAAKDAAYILSERLRKQFAGLKLENFPQITISLGIATYPFDGRELDDLIKKADVAMYAAKRAGRNKVVKYSPDIKRVGATNIKPIEN